MLVYVRQSGQFAIGMQSWYLLRPGFVWRAPASQAVHSVLPLPLENWWHAVRLSVMTVSGENVCTASGIDAGVSSSFPARSVARTRRSCAPSASSARTCGERHTLYAAPSSAHSKVLGSLLQKETLRKAAKDAIAAVRLVKLVSGAVVSARRLAVETFASVVPSANCTL